MIRSPGSQFTQKIKIFVTQAGQMTVPQLVRILLFRPKTRITLIRLTCASLSVILILMLLSSRQNPHSGERDEDPNSMLQRDGLPVGEEDRLYDHNNRPHHPRHKNNDRNRHHRHGLRSAAPASSTSSLSAKEQELFHRLNPFNESWGVNGSPVELTSLQEKRDAEKLFKLGAFNVYISDRIAPNRILPEARPDECAAAFDELSETESLPTASVIVIFTDEIWSALIRTLWSVWNRSPDHLLKEIILVDDFSSRAELKQPLDLYCKHHFGDRITILRSQKREGLIRSRIRGAKIASGDVLIFLDSHCEATNGWLEPLLKTIKKDRRNVVCPVIDVISDKTMEYSVGDRYYFQVGGFTWSGHFTW